MFRTEYNVNQVQYISLAPESMLLEAERKKELNLDAWAFKSVAVIQIIDSLALKAHHNHIPDLESRRNEMTQGFERKWTRKLTTVNSNSETTIQSST